MKKQFMTFVACAIMAGAMIPVYADNETKSLSQQARIKMQATIKTAVDFLAIPVVGAPVALLVYTLLPKTELPFLHPSVMQVINGGASAGVGLLAGIASSEVYM